MVLENVRALDFVRPGQTCSNAATCQRAISYELDMITVAIEISAHMVGACQSRRRIYLLCISRHRLRKAGISDEDARNRLKVILGQLTHSWRLIPFQSLKSRADSTLVSDYMRRTARINRGTVDNTQFKWWRRHRRLARQINFPISNLGVFPATELTHTGLNSLPRRDRELFSLKGLTLPSANLQLLDTSQKFEHTIVPPTGVSPRVTPHGLLFDLRDVREISGSEKLRIQNIFYPPAIEETLETNSGAAHQKLLCSLAGNGYEGRSFGVAVTALLLFAAELEFR